ncbi:MAG: 50S ribosomal protein L18 [bacterium]|nr:50S ribosomal protein L18 [bacterium]
MSTFSRNISRQRRHARIRRKVSGTAEYPRLAVFRSSRHIYAQVIDDQVGHTLVSASSLEKDLRNEDISPIEMAKRVGARCAERAMEKGINSVVFDRGGYQFHGRVAALAEGAREQGLEF